MFKPCFTLGEGLTLTALAVLIFLFYKHLAYYKKGKSREIGVWWKILAIVATTTILNWIILSIIWACKGMEFDKMDSHTFIALMTSIVAVCASFVVGFQIYNSIEHKEAVRKINELRNNESVLFDQLLKSNGELLKADANSSRMIGFLLNINGKPIWAIGWICRAIIRYKKCDKSNVDFSFSYGQIKKYCFPMIHECINSFIIKVDKATKKSGKTVDRILLTDIFNSDNDEKNDNVISRAFKDLIDSVILTEKEDALIESFLKLTYRYLDREKLEEALLSSKCSKSLLKGKMSSYEGSETLHDLFLSLKKENK